MDNVKWGIIGCGNVTEVKSGPAFRKVKGSELIAVMRRDKSKARDYAIRHKVSKWYSSADGLIADPEINAVYVATPPDTHAKYTIQALQKGKPVYVEKPMARNYQECLEMIKTSEETGVPLFVAYYRRALPGFLKVKKLINQGAIGKVRIIQIQLFKSFPDYSPENIPWRVVPEIAGGGHFFDLASHQIDYLDYLFGTVNEVKSIVRNQAGLYEAEDIITVLLSFDNDIICSGNWCFSSASVADRDVMEIIGEKGSIRFSCFGFTPIVLENEEGLQKYEYSKPEHVQQPMIQMIVDDLLGKGQSPSTGVTAARTNQVMDLIVKEFYNK